MTGKLGGAGGGGEGAREVRAARGEAGGTDRCSGESIEGSGELPSDVMI